MVSRTAQEAAVLFANLNANALYDGMEEVQASSLVDSALDALRSAVKANDGRVIKTIGDEVLALFSDAPQAARAAIEMQRHFSVEALAWPGGSQLTIGFAWGGVIDQDGDVFGDTVSVA